MCGLFDDDERDSKRSLTKHEKDLLYLRANRKCEMCGDEIKDSMDMEAGHNKAWSKGGKTTLKNSLCLCHHCNRIQATESKKSLLKKLGVEDKESVMKGKLDSLSISQLKDLAKKKGIKIKGTVEENLFSRSTKAPTKKKYISKLKGIVSEEEINSLPKEVTKVKKKKKRNTSGGFFGF
jgi:hypothetical protein